MISLKKLKLFYIKNMKNIISIESIIILLYFFYNRDINKIYN